MKRNVIFLTILCLIMQTAGSLYAASSIELESRDVFQSVNNAFPMSHCIAGLAKISVDLVTDNNSSDAPISHKPYEKSSKSGADAGSQKALCNQSGNIEIRFAKNVACKKCSPTLSGSVFMPALKGLDYISIHHEFACNTLTGDCGRAIFILLCMMLYLMPRGAIDSAYLSSIYKVKVLCPVQKF